MHDVFISYASGDKAVADAACAILEDRGIRCWIAPRDITPGADWSAEIVEAISGSKVMVLVYSASANESPQIKREVERAVSKGLPILPFRIEDVPMSKALEYFISSPHWLDALSPPLERHLEYLAQTVQLLLSRGDKAAATAAPTRPASSGAPARAAPPPAPAPTPSQRRAVVLAAGGLLLLALGFGGYKLLSGGDSGVDRRVIGNWTSAAPDPAGLKLQTLAVGRDGSYRLHFMVRDSGTITAAGGRYQMLNAAHIPIQGTYAAAGPGAISIGGPLGTAVWTRTGGGTSRGGSPLAGNWELAATIEGIPWRMKFEIGGNGGYRLVSQTDDAGQLSTAGGSWTMSSTSGRVANGTYQVLSANSFSTQGPTGTSVWRR